MAPSPATFPAETIRVKDLGKLRGWRENALVGYGIVTGLAGTGDSSSNKVTRQTMANVLSQFNLTIAADQIQSRNVAMVMVSAALPAFARQICGSAGLINENKPSRIEVELRQRWPETGRVVLMHRTGTLALGESSVIAVVSAPRPRLDQKTVVQDDVHAAQPFFASCPRGLEWALVQELESLGLTIVQRVASGALVVLVRSVTSPASRNSTRPS